MDISNSSIVICSIVRDAAEGLRHNIPVIQELCRFFKEYKIVIYENDSKDKTKSILESWRTSDPSNIHIVSEDTDSSKTIPSPKSVAVNPFFSRRRIEKMASLRNKYLEYIDRHNWSPTYIMIVDLDVAQLFLNPILNSFNRTEEWDAITAYGYSTSPRLKRRYHDTYAFCEKGGAGKPQTEIMIHRYADTLASQCESSDALIPVDSAFGGLAIYKAEGIMGLRYTVEQNDDPRVEVRCEHFGLNRQMAARGYDRIFINPRMTLKYQAITVRFLINKLINSFCRLFI